MFKIKSQWQFDFFQINLYLHYNAVSYTLNFIVPIQPKVIVCSLETLLEDY